MVRPRASPWATTPRMVQGRPSAAVARSGIAVLQRAADARRGDRPASSVSSDDGQAPCPAPRPVCEEAGPAAAAVAERKVGAAGEVARTDPLVQHVRHKCLRGHPAECGVEAQFVQDRHAPAPPVRPPARPTASDGTAGRRGGKARADAARSSAPRAGRRGGPMRGPEHWTWPRCTPSKLPSATIAPRASPGRSRQSWKIRITARGGTCT